MAKSFWMSDQKGNFSDGGKDSFDESKDYIGIRLQQGVPLLDRDWNELEDIRRYQDWALRAKYLGDGTPDNGFAISLIEGKIDDFNIFRGRCLIDGFEAVNRTNTSYSKQADVPALTIPQGKRTDQVYIDLWVREIHGTEELKNDQDVKIETCARHKIEWRVRVSESEEIPKPQTAHHHYTIASIERDGGSITAINDLRTALRINSLFKVISVGSQGNIGIRSENPSRPLTVRAVVASQELIGLEDPKGKVMWHINQNPGGNNPGLNFVEADVAKARLFLKAGGNVGINNINPQRSLHVEGSEVHSGGTGAGLSFANRDAPNNGAFVENGADGQRWEWYARGQAARLWAAGDKLVVDKEGNLTVAGGITFSGNPSRRIYGDVRTGAQAVVLKGNWDELEVKGRVIDWTGANLHIGYQNDHSEHFVYIGAGNARVKGVEINHGPQKGVKVGSDVGLKLTSTDGGGVIYGFDLNHSIFFRIGQDGEGNVTDYHQHGTHRFFTNGSLEVQAERMRITQAGRVGIGTTDPQRMLHVEGSEIHSGGSPTAGFSFANRDAPNKGAYVESGADGQRWVWHATGQVAHLWAAGNKLDVDKDGNLNVAGGITFSGNASRRIYGDARAGVQAVVLKGNWDELEVKGRVLDWTGSNFHIGYQNDHSNDFVYIGGSNARVKGVEINHGPLKGVKVTDNVGLKLNSSDGGGVIYSFDMNHSIFFRIGQDGAGNVTDFHQYGMHRFFTGGDIENQKERMRITSGGAVAIGTTDPKRTLHVEGSEIHSGGTGAGFSFANRDAPNNGAFVDNGADGQRWVWHSWGKVARLWAGGDKFWVDKDGNVGATGKIPTSSDLRLKTSIKPLNDVLSKLEKIRGVYFDWNDVYKSLGGSIDRREIGLIAQEVEAVFPEVVMDWGDKGYLGIDYGRFSTVLVEAVKELNSTIKGLHERIEHLESNAAKR